MKKQKFLFIYCGRPGHDDQTISQPLGILYLGAILEKAGIPVKCVDERTFSREEIFDHIEKADVVGLSVMTPYIRRAFDWAGHVKSLGKMCLIGGPHPTVDPHGTLETGLFDILFIREAELTIREALPILNDKEKLKAVPGLAFFDERGEKYFTPERSFNENLDAVPFPARHLLPMERYFSRNRERLVYVYTSRGCPYSCIFCQKNLYGRKFRTRSVDNICDELEIVQNAYRPGAVLFIDEIFTYRRKRVFDICDAILRRGIKLYWCCETRVDRVDYPMMTAMRRAGMRRIYFGVESGSPKSLRTLNKRFTVQQALKTLKEARRANLWTKLFLILGAPDETMADYELTARMLRKAHPDMVRTALFNPLMGSPSFERYRDRIDFDLILKEYVTDSSTAYRHEHFTVEELNEIGQRMVSQYSAWYDRPSQRFKRWAERMRFYALNPKAAMGRIREKYHEG